MGLNQGTLNESHNKFHGTEHTMSQSDKKAAYDAAYEEASNIIGDGVDPELAAAAADGIQAAGSNASSEAAAAMRLAKLQESSMTDADIILMLSDLIQEVDYDIWKETFLGEEALEDSDDVREFVSIVRAHMQD